MIEEIGNDILNNTNTMDTAVIYRIYYNDCILQMDSGKHQWNNSAAAKNALHHMIETHLRASHPSEWWLLNDGVYKYIMSKVEIRKC